MAPTVCLGAYALRFPEGGAYMWTFLNWALGLRDLGCRVIWLDSFDDGVGPDEARHGADWLRAELATWGLEPADIVATDRAGNAPEALGAGAPGAADAASAADLFVDLGYDLAPTAVAAFPRSVFVDIDPGLTQCWLAIGELDLAPHDLWFTYGETVGRAGSHIPTAGREWLYTAPPVHLPAWPVAAPPQDAAFTTVTAWWAHEEYAWVNGAYVDNSKREAFLPYLDLPRHTTVGLELALPLAPPEDDTGDLDLLRQHGWAVHDSRETSPSAAGHRAYVQSSRGEFSCMKTAYALLETAWTGERSLNYLASGRPVVLQDTGLSSFLPRDSGLLRFTTPAEAAEQLERVDAGYDEHASAARHIAEEWFDAAKVLPAFLERALS